MTGNARVIITGAASGIGAAAAAERLPRRAIDRGLRRHLARRISRGAWSESELGAPFAERLASRRKR